MNGVAPRRNRPQLSLFDRLHSPKVIKNPVFARTDRKMAAQMGFCPHGREVGAHGTPKCPHGLNFRRTDGKMTARSGFLAHGKGKCPHKSKDCLPEAIFRRTD
jgi:hypothetical protein